jgi:hypothetical protein
MLKTKRKPASVGEILIEEFMGPMGLTQAALAEAMGVAQACQRALQRATRGDGANRAYPRPRVRQQPAILAERTAARGFVGGDALTPRIGTDRTRPTAERCGLIATVLLGQKT